MTTIDLYILGITVDDYGVYLLKLMTMVATKIVRWEFLVVVASAIVPFLIYSFIVIIVL